MKKKKILLILVIVVVALIAFGVYKIVIGNQATKWSGLYSNGKDIMYLFQNDSDLYFSNGVHRGKIQITDGQATYEESIEEEKKTYTFTISNDILTITSDGNYIAGGKYTKTADLTLEEYFSHVFGGSSMFDSKYNGYFKKDDINIYIYQVGEEMVEVIINSPSFTMDADFKIISDGLLKLDTTEVDATIQLTVDTLTLKVPVGFLNSGDVKLSGIYKKEKSITMYDIMNNEMFYYYQ